jgi:hypothetical protein
MLKIHVNDRNYGSWEVFDMDNFNKISLSIDPVSSKLFTNDVFTVDDNNTVTIVHSSIRNGPVPGVLVLDGNKTYGRELKEPKISSHTTAKQKYTAGRLLYKCIPDDIRLPAFLVPYEIKHLGFSKVYKNLYVTINFEDWNDKHPRAKLDNVIGPVDILDNFYEYQLYCK